MKKPLQILSVIFTALAFGSAIFMTFVVAPMAFANFPRNIAGNITGMLFTPYFVILIVCAGFLLLAIFAGFGRPFSRKQMILALFAGVLLLTAAGNLFFVLPAAREARTDQARVAEFKTAHRTSMILNSFSLLSALGMTIFLPLVICARE